MLGDYYITGRITVAGLRGCSGNRDRSVNLRKEATGLADGLDAGLNKEVCIKDLSQL